jgi:hypothetical protein
MPWLRANNDGVTILENRHPKETERVCDCARSSKSPWLSFVRRQFAQDLLRPEDFFHKVRVFTQMMSAMLSFFSCLWKTTTGVLVVPSSSGCGFWGDLDPFPAE